MRFCPSRVARQAVESAGVCIRIGDASERFVLFENGKPVDTDHPQGEIAVERQADLNLLRIGEERYEMPDAVVFGG